MLIHPRGVRSFRVTSTTYRRLTPGGSFVRKILLPLLAAAALIASGSGVAAAETDKLPSFCIGKKKDNQGRITCKPPSEGMRWQGFGRCATRYASGGWASWWERSAVVQGTELVGVTCVDSKAVKIWVDMLYWEEIK
jgi:hypothetical protein